MNPRTTARTILAAATAAIGLFGPAPSAFATVERISVDPAAPAVCDSVQLVVAGSIPNPCYTIRGFRVGAPEPLPTMGPIPTFRIPVRIRVEEPGPVIDPPPPCPAVIEPYRLTGELGKLPFGNYWVDATEYVYPFPADSTSPVDSSHVTSTFFVATEPCSTGASCVLLGFAAAGDVPRLDGCTARANPGGRACLDVTLMNSVPVGALQTEIVLPPEVGTDGGAGPFVPVSVTATSRAAGFEVGWVADGSTAKIVLYSTTGATISPGGGAVLHVCYDVKPDAREKVYDLRFVRALVSSPQGESLPFCPTFAEILGHICVGVSGCDVDGNGSGDVRDIVSMVRCILAGAACPDTVRAKSDCNGDGSVDVRDIVCCVTDILSLDENWGSDAGPSGAPPGDVARVRFAGPATWTSPLEGHVAIAIDRGRLFGGAQFVLQSNGLARVRDIALEDPLGPYALQWRTGPHGEARVMLYDRGVVEAGLGSATGGAGDAVPPVAILLTLEPAADSDEGAIVIRSLTGAAKDGGMLSIQGEGETLQVPPSSVAGVATILPARPNPFVTETEISFALPSTARASVRLFDVSGRLVRTLHDGVTNAGVYRKRWDGRDDRGRTVGAGIYFAHLTVGNAVRTARILRIR